MIGPHALAEIVGIRDPHEKPSCPHRVLMHLPQMAGVKCRACGATWNRHRRYLRSQVITRLVRASRRPLPLHPRLHLP